MLRRVQKADRKIRASLEFSKILKKLLTRVDFSAMIKLPKGNRLQDSPVKPRSIPLGQDSGCGAS